MIDLILKRFGPDLPVGVDQNEWHRIIAYRLFHQWNHFQLITKFPIPWKEEEVSSRLAAIIPEVVERTAWVRHLDGLLQEAIETMLAAPAGMSGRHSGMHFGRLFPEAQRLSRDVDLGVFLLLHEPTILKAARAYLRMPEEHRFRTSGLKSEAFQLSEFIYAAHGVLTQRDRKVTPTPGLAASA